jgi:cysteine desulfuration protein SufE
MNITDIQNEIIEEFQLFPDWESKYEYLLEMGNKLQPLDNSSKTDAHLVQGCTSKAWITADLVDGKMHFSADGETAIARGILALVLRVLNDQKPGDILAAELFFIESIGLQDNLSITRAQGLESLIRKIYQLASQYPHD